jgi:hypothetical protein
MNELCLMDCAPKRTAAGFELKAGITFSTLPRFSLHEWNKKMSGRERQAMVGVRMKLLEDHIRGEVMPVIPLRVNRNGRVQRLGLYQNWDEEE